MSTDWRKIDEKLIKGGELVLDLSFLEDYEDELEALNKGKVGPPYRLTPSYIQLLTAIRYLCHTPIHQLEGFTRSLHKLAPKHTPADQLGHPKTHPSADPQSLPATQRQTRTRIHRHRLRRGTEFPEPQEEECRGGCRAEGLHAEKRHPHGRRDN